MASTTGLCATLPRGLCPSSPFEIRRQGSFHRTDFQHHPTTSFVRSTVGCNCKASSLTGGLSAANAALGIEGWRLLGGQRMWKGRLSFVERRRKGWGVRDCARAQQVTFRARKTLNLPVKELNLSVDEYLQNAERVVKITLPDSKRVQYIGKSTWRARLKPVEFFSVSATPICDIKAWYEDRALRIFSNSLKLEFSNSGNTSEDFNLRLSLSGSLRALRPRSASPPPKFTTPQTNSATPQTPIRRQPTNGARPTPAPQPAARPASLSNRSVGAHLQTARAAGGGSAGTTGSAASEGGVRMEGAVSLGLSVDLPMPLSLIPEQALSAVGDRILDSILSNLQGSLLRGLLLDYAAWCRESERDAAVQTTASGFREPTRS